MSDDTEKFTPCEHYPSEFPFVIKDITFLSLTDRRLRFAFERRDSAEVVRFLIDIQRVLSVRDATGQPGEVPSVVLWDYDCTAATGVTQQKKRYRFNFHSNKVAKMFVKILKGELEKVEWKRGF